MGNTLLDQIKKEDPVDIFQQWLQQNPDLVNRKVLNHNKLFSSNVFTYSQRQLKLAVYFRRDPSIQLNNYLKAFQIIQKLVQYHRCLHILPMRILGLKQIDKKEIKYEQNLLLATRQNLYRTLQQRLQSRPYLSEQQKFWFIYQMIFAVYTIHETFNIYHGSIKTSNFLISNQQYLFLTDFASYKPNYILQDTEQGLSEFRLFYSSSVVKCNLAPQKFADKDSLPPQGLNNKLFNFYVEQSFDSLRNTNINDNLRSTTNETKDLRATAFDLKNTTMPSMDSTTTINIPRRPKKNGFGPDHQLQNQIQRLKAMDIFSLGLSILQVLNDGHSSMNYEQLLKGKKQGLDFESKITQAINKLQSLQHKTIKNLLMNMLQMNPQKRLNITQIQHGFQKCMDVQMFLLFWCCLSAFNKSSFNSCDLRIHLLFSIINFIQIKIKGYNEYKFENKLPKCLKKFNSLKIFVQMIEKGLIFAPGISKLSIFQKLTRYYDRNQDKQINSVQHQELNVQDDDQRRRYFINSQKKSKISRRLSLEEGLIKIKLELCPLNIQQLQKVINIKHIPLKLTQIGLKPSRLQEIFRIYKNSQSDRQQRLKYKPFYKNCQVIIKIIFSCIRGCKYVADKLLGIQMIGMIALDCSDRVLLKLVIPLLMNLTQDSDISVARQAFLRLINTFYIFRDPFHQQEDIHYFDMIFQFFISIIKQSKLRQCLFSNFKKVYEICEWLELHYKCFNKESKNNLTKIIQVLKSYYGSYSRQEIKVLLNKNIPDHVLPDMFEFYISLINTDRIQGLKLSVYLAENISSSRNMHILDALDSCIQSGLDQYGLGLFYSIQYFRVRKSVSSFIIKKITTHVINPNIWIRSQALNFVKMCLNQYPPTKNYFFFRDIFEPPFPLKSQDIQYESLLPSPLKDTDVDLKQRKLKMTNLKLCQLMFNDYLKVMKVYKLDRHRNQLEDWNASKEKISQALNFQNYIKKNIQQLYENNLLYYIFNMNSKYVVQVTDKQKPVQKNYSQLMATLMKVTKFSNDIGYVDYQKKQLFQSFQGTINSSFQKLLAKKNRNIFEIVQEKLKLSESIILIGQVLNKFQLFKIKPIPKLGNYIKNPVLQEKIQPKGVLISQIFQHGDSVTCLQKVADFFFLSGSNDGTLRIFDSKKIMMNITTTSQAKLEIKADNSEQKAKISSIAAFEQTYTAVVGTHRGHIRIIPIERMSSGKQPSKQDQFIKYNVNGQLQKVITFSNQLKNECFCYITAEGNLGVQDIRAKVQSMSCNIGRQRGLPRSLCSTNRNSVLVGTIDGYLINYDIRYNIVSSVFQLNSDRQALPITGIYPNHIQLDQNQQLFSLTYPSKNYEFSCFDLSKNKLQFGPQKQYINMSNDELLTTPYLLDKTSQQQFKLCRNGLIWRKNYNELSDFNKNFNIYNYLSDPLTRKESKIRQIWLDNCKNRYNQISSLYNKKNLSFLQYIGNNILTNPNPTKNTDKKTPPFILLTEKKQTKDYIDIDRALTHKPSSSHKIYTFSCQQSQDYYTCCKVLPNMVVLGCRNSIVKIYV